MPINGLWQHKEKKTKYEASSGIQVKCHGYWYDAVIYRNTKTGAELVRLKDDFLNTFEPVNSQDKS